MYVFIILSVITITIVVLLNIFAFKYIINKSIKRFIQPKLQGVGLAFIRYKWLGFFSHGDFKDDKFILLPSLKYGYPVISTYIDVYYFEVSTEKRITVRIDTFFVFIVRVLYSDEF